MKLGLLEQRVAKHPGHYSRAHPHHPHCSSRPGTRADTSASFKASHLRASVPPPASFSPLITLAPRRIRVARSPTGVVSSSRTMAYSVFVLSPAHRRRHLRSPIVPPVTSDAAHARPSLAVSAFRASRCSACHAGGRSRGRLCRAL
ncbi:hypothetical protein B0H19DRAFT_1202167, partial [Mycena capillaripes]